MEHRCGTRYAVDVPVYVRTADASASAFGRLREVSASGGFVDTRLEACPPSRVKVQLLTDRRPTSRPLVVDAQVMRAGPGGIYVSWTEQAQDLVSQLIAQRTPRDRAPPLKRAQTRLTRISMDDSPDS